MIPGNDGIRSQAVVAAIPAFRTDASQPVALRLDHIGIAHLAAAPRKPRLRSVTLGIISDNTPFFKLRVDPPVELVETIMGIANLRSVEQGDGS